MSEASNNTDASKKPELIPEHVSPVRYLDSLGGGAPYQSYKTLDNGRLDPDAAVVFEADSGGQILLTCPLRFVRATNEVLQQLLVDLECISWGLGFDPDEHVAEDAQMFFEHLPVGSAVPGGMGGGAVIDGLWMHRRLVALGILDQVESVVFGSRQRLDLPKGLQERI